jgi:hypothetical protein
MVRNITSTRLPPPTASTTGFYRAIAAKTACGLEARYVSPDVVGYEDLERTKSRKKER